MVNIAAHIDSLTINLIHPKSHN